MKILITGAAGFLGKAVLERILMRGADDIRVLVRNREGAEKVRASIDKSYGKNVEILIGDFSVPDDAERALADVEKLIHVASVGKGTTTNIFINNVVGSRVLLENLVRTGRCREILLVSSLAVYGLYGLGRDITVDESVPVDPYPERRDIYTYSKVLQEQIFRKYQYDNGNKQYDLCIVRPGPIYGSGGTALPARIGLKTPFFFLNFGNRNYVPLTYVDNCAEAIAFLSSLRIDGTGIFNIIDPDVPRSSQYLKKYRKYVPNFRFVSIPYVIILYLSKWIELYSKRSKGQLPAFLTVYKSENMWKRVKYDNSKLMQVGWKPVVSTEVGLDKTFKGLNVSL